METQIRSMVMGPKGAQAVNLFAYSTNGLPGLEIHLGQLPTKSMREKFIFLSKTRRLPIPLKRYVLCAELDGLALNNDQLNTLELPLLFLYWHLAGLIPLMNLSDCLLQGSITSKGQIHHNVYSDQTYERLRQQFIQRGEKNFTLILDGEASSLLEFQCLPTMELLQGIDCLTLASKCAMMVKSTTEAHLVGFSQ